MPQFAPEREQKELLVAMAIKPEDGNLKLILAHLGALMGFPWDEWAPGVLNKTQMETLLTEGYITYSSGKPELDHSSMDLTLSDEAFAMKEGSVKPLTLPYDWFISKGTNLAKRHTKLPDGTFELKQHHTYVFRLREKLEARLRNSGVIYGQATAKSTVGRVDVLARLIVDGMKTYECFDPQGLKEGSGTMYLEITPITFNVRVKPGTSLSQLRLFYGRPEDVVIHAKELLNTIFRNPDHRDESLTVSLSNAVIGNLKGTPCEGVAFRSKALTKSSKSVQLWTQRQKPDPCEYWEIEVADEFGRLLIQPGTFYILRSKEKLCVPKGVAIYCRASDETMGEMRIHYAGFVHPYFGLYREDKRKGTPLIFEVRGHQVKVSLADQEKMATLIFYRMSEDAPELTDEEKKKEARGYGSQDLKLSKFFGDWPKHLQRISDGTVKNLHQTRRKKNRRARK